MSDWAGIKKAINSDLSKPLDTLIKDYLGNSTYGLSALKTLMTGGNIPIVKSVQRGCAETNSNYMTVYISSVNINKAIVLLNVRSGSNSNTSLYITEFSSTSFTFNLVNYSSSRVSWQVIEFY